MATTAILIDRRPAYLERGRPVASLLLSPLGAGTMLEHLRDQARVAGAQELSILPTFASAETYTDALRRVVPDATVLDSARFDGLLAGLEPSDWLLLLDTRHFPLLEFASRLRADEARGPELTTHVVCLRQEQGGTQERVVCDERRRVRRIQRLYDGVTHLELAGVCASRVSVAAAPHLRAADLVCLTSLRAHLSACGVPSRDVAASGPELNLTQAADLLALNERAVREATSGPVCRPFEERAPGIWVGPGCDIHTTSRIYGPVIIHTHVTIGPRAVIVGPTVLGREARVERQALVAHSLVGPGAHVGAGLSVVRDVLAPGANGDRRAPRGSASTGWRPVVTAPPVGPQRGAGSEPEARATNDHCLGPRVKRAFDFGLALCGLVVLAPLLLLVAALVKLTSRGPAFFSHRREGRDERVFRCWKFRTMVDGAHAQQRALYQANAVDGPQFKLPNDPRVTRLGGWLRRTNIDELPQLYNVLRGEMSLIGPRPSPFRENQVCVPWRNARLSVRPGITGLWQVCRRDRSAGDFHQWIWFDVLYVRHWSLGLDLRILLATLLTLGGRWSVPLTWMIPARKLQHHSPTDASGSLPSATMLAPSESSRAGTVVLVNA